VIDSISNGIDLLGVLSDKKVMVAGAVVLLAATSTH
jgi:ABC-type xylose transport system permease subunit